MEMGAVLAVIREFGIPTLFCLWLMKRDAKREAIMLELQTKTLVLLSTLVKLQGLDHLLDDKEQP